MDRIKIKKGYFDFFIGEKKLEKDCIKLKIEWPNGKVEESIIVWKVEIYKNHKNGNAGERIRPYIFKKINSLSVYIPIEEKLKAEFIK